MEIIWLLFESSRCPNLTPQLPHPLTRPHTIITLENMLRKYISTKTWKFVLKE